MKKSVLMAVVFVMAFTAAAMAEFKVTFQGYQWLRYEVIQVGAKQDSTSDRNSFSIPRTYLRMRAIDSSLGIGGFLTVDINNDQFGQKVATTASAGAVDWGIWVKYGYVDFDLPVPEMKLRVGLQKFYFGSVDKWAYPITLSQAYADRHRIIPSSAEQGIALVGILPEGWGDYELAVYNGAGYKKLEDNAEKMYVVSSTIVPLPGLSVRGSYLKTITNAIDAPTRDYSATGVVVTYATGPVEAWVEYNVKKEVRNATATNSGVREGVIAYLGVKLFDPLLLSLRYDAHNPDTGAERDEVNFIMAGLTYSLSDKIDLQFSYELEQPKMLTGHPNNDHRNRFQVQTKWSW